MQRPSTGKKLALTVGIASLAALGAVSLAYPDFWVIGFRLLEVRLKPERAVGLLDAPAGSPEERALRLALADTRPREALLRIYMSELSDFHPGLQYVFNALGPNTWAAIWVGKDGLFHVVDTTASSDGGGGSRMSQRRWKAAKSSRIQEVLGAAGPEPLVWDKHPGIEFAFVPAAAAINVPARGGGEIMAPVVDGMKERDAAAFVCFVRKAGNRYPEAVIPER